MAMAKDPRFGQDAVEWARRSLDGGRADAHFLRKSVGAVQVWGGCIAQAPLVQEILLVQCSRQLLDWVNWRQAVAVRLRLGRPVRAATVPGSVVIHV